jgi:DNA polymerase III subunit chi
MKVDFWQLSSDPAEKVCALIAGRVLGNGERLLVVSEAPEQRAAISRALWKAGPDSFLANGEADAPGADRQPVLLSATQEAANGASHVVYADGKWRGEAGFARAFLLFAQDTIDEARATWRALDGRDDLERAFYRQEDGKWIKVG